MAPGPDAGEQLGPLLARVRELAERFAAAGHRTHLVGGAVRDALLGQDHRGDLDLTTDARPERIKAVVAGWADVVWTQGERFGTIGARHGAESFEITTHRTEAYEPGSRKPRVEYADELVTDLSRRDFTINALAADALTGELVDPFGGRDDLARRVLRTPLEPEVSFSDDPLRMLRAARFLTRFDLAVDPALRAAAARLAERVGIVSAERVREELVKLLLTGAPSAGLGFLAEVGVLAAVLPEAAVDRPVDEAPADPCDRLALLLAGTPEDVVRRRLLALRCSAAEQHEIRTLLAALAAVPPVPEPLGDGAVRRWVQLVGPLRDRAARLAALLDPAAGARLAERVAALVRVEDLDDLGPPLDGEDVMRILALGPGPEVGRVLERLRGHRLDHGPLSRDAAEALVRRWRDER